MAEIVVTDEAVEAGARALGADEFATKMDDARAALEAAAPLLQMQLDREALARIIRTEIAGYGITPSTAEPAAVADILALLSPEETE